MRSSSGASWAKYSPLHNQDTTATTSSTSFEAGDEETHIGSHSNEKQLPSLPKLPRRHWPAYLSWIFAAILITALSARFAWLERSCNRPNTYIPADLVSQERSWQDIDTLYIFGDSYTDSGNESSMAIPEFFNPFNTTTHQFNSTPNWVNFLHQYYLPNRFTAYNFATGGSTVDHTVVKPFLIGTSLRTQVDDLLLPDFASLMPSQRDSAAYVTWFGVNDIYMWYQGYSDPAIITPPPMRNIFASYTASIERIYQAGGRNFLFLTMPPVNRATNIGEKAAKNVTLLEQVYEHREEIVGDIESFNARVFKMRNEFRQRHKDVSAWVFDAHSWMARALETPEEYEAMQGVDENKVVCDPKPLAGSSDWYDRRCKDGSLMRQHGWTPLHAAFTLHNATAWRMARDCFGVEKRGFCL